VTTPPAWLHTDAPHARATKRRAHRPHCCTGSHRRQIDRVCVRRGRVVRCCVCWQSAACMPSMTHRCALCARLWARRARRSPGIHPLTRAAPHPRWDATTATPSRSEPSSITHQHHPTSRSQPVPRTPRPVGATSTSTSAKKRRPHATQPLATLAHAQTPTTARHEPSS